MTILWDSYRFLTSSVLFWVVMGISMLVALVFASIGFDADGYSVLFGLWEIESSLVNTESGYAELFYLVVFTNIIVTWWLAYLSIALGLISCNSIFPQFLTAGSVDVAVSKPISRVTLFVTKYVGSLIFVFLQVGVFCVIVFIAMGIRLDSWNFSIFWAVPILVFVFSLIYCVGVLVSVMTRSAMLALLAMLLVWGASLMVQWAENAFYNMSYAAEESGVMVDMETGELVSNEGEDYEGWKKAHRITKAVAWPLPKTREVTLMIKQKMKTDKAGGSLAGMSLLAFMDDEMMEGQESGAAQKTANRHSTFYIIGSSALFEFIILSLACWKFCRKDY